MLPIKKRLSIRIINLIIGVIFLFSNPIHVLAIDFHNALRPKHQFWTKEGEERHRKLQLETLKEHYGFEKVYTKQESLEKLKELEVKTVRNFHVSDGMMMYFSLETVRNMIGDNIVVLVEIAGWNEVTFAFISPTHAHGMSPYDARRVKIQGITLPGGNAVTALNIAPIFTMEEVEDLIIRVSKGSDDMDALGVLEMLEDTETYDLNQLKKMLEKGNSVESRMAAATIYLRGGQFRMEDVKRVRIREAIYSLEGLSIYSDSEITLLSILSDLGWIEKLSSNSSTHYFYKIDKENINTVVIDGEKVIRMSTYDPVFFKQLKDQKKKVVIIVTNIEQMEHLRREQIIINAGLNRDVFVVMLTESKQIAQWESFKIANFDHSLYYDLGEIIGDPKNVLFREIDIVNAVINKKELLRAIASGV